MGCVLFVALIFALKSLEKENQELTKANSALRQVLRTLATEEQVAGGCYTESGSCKSGYYKLSGGLKCCPRLSEEEVGFSNYKCAARNDCIYECQMDDEDKSWYSCMKECPKNCEKDDDTSDSVDPEDSDS